MDKLNPSKPSPEIFQEVTSFKLSKNSNKKEKFACDGNQMWIEKKIATAT